jgi:hypothetical protein
VAVEKGTKAVISVNFSAYGKRFSSTIVTLDVSALFGVECDRNSMTTTETPHEAVYCNNCGTANPQHAAVCCNCGHVHARIVEVPREAQSAIVVVEQWFWIALRIICGVSLCIGRVLPASGTTLNAALLGRIFGSLAIPVCIGAVLGGASWARSSRWFLGAALVLPIWTYFATVFGRIHLR